MMMKEKMAMKELWKNKKMSAAARRGVSAGLCRETEAGEGGGESGCQASRIFGVQGFGQEEMSSLKKRDSREMSRSRPSANFQKGLLLLLLMRFFVARLNRSVVVNKKKKMAKTKRRMQETRQMMARRGLHDRNLATARCAKRKQKRGLFLWRHDFFLFLKNWNKAIPRRGKSPKTKTKTERCQ